MLRKELDILFTEMPKVVQDKLQPVMENLLERAGDLDDAGTNAPDYEDEREAIMKEVHKVKYLNDQWQIMNARKNN